MSSDRLSIACRARQHAECIISWCACDCHKAASSRRDVRCPGCRWRFKTSVAPGHPVWCKKCNAEFID